MHQQTSSPPTLFKSFLHSLSVSLVARFGRPLWERTPGGLRFGWVFSDDQPDDAEVSATIKTKYVDVKVGATHG